MVYAIILAAGSGTRMNEISKLPKQYLKLDNFLIIEHCLKKFLKSNLVDKIIIVYHNDYFKVIDNLIKKYQKKDCQIYSCTGGANRNLSIHYAIDFIKQKLKPHKDDIVLTHDSARIFVEPKTIDESIVAAKKYGASEVVNYATDTINTAKRGFIEEVLVRKNVRIGQTPQCFKWKIATKVYEKISKEFEFYTDAIGLLLKHNIKVAEVISNNHNMKITTPFDFLIAKFYLKELAIKNKKKN